MRNHGRPEPVRDRHSARGLGTYQSHERLGWNYRLDELSAALGVAQMGRLDRLIEERQRVAELYTRRLIGNPDIIVPTVSSDTFMSWFVYVVRLSDRFTEHDRDEIILGLRRHDVGASNYFPPVHLLKHLRQRYGFDAGSYPVCESVSQRTLALPFFTQITEREIDLVCQTLDLMITRTTFARED
jgi:perosamine synthetase